LHVAHAALHARLGTALSIDGGLEGLLAVHAWTATLMCLRPVPLAPPRASVAPVLQYFRLLLSTLHALPDQFYKGGTLYRAESGVMRTWRAKKFMIVKDGILEHCFYVPTNSEVLYQPRTNKRLW